MIDGSEAMRPVGPPFLPANFVRIRRFQPGDLAGVLELVNATFREQYDHRMYLALAATWPDATLVAVDGSQRLVGIIFASLQREVEGRILIFAIQPELRNRGLGSRMLREFLLVCLSRGMRAVTLEVRVSNESAIRFYTRHGYRLVGHLPSFYRDGEAGYVMRKAIP